MKISEKTLQHTMMVMAKAHDQIVSERERGAALALRCGNGMATTYWRKIAQSASRALAKQDTPND